MIAVVCVLAGACGSDSKKGAQAINVFAAASLTEAFNVSSLFLMATPYTVVGTIGAWLYIASRRRARQVDHDDATPEVQ